MVRPPRRRGEPDGTETVWPAGGTSSASNKSDNWPLVNSAKCWNA
jgi:hypothetical protein